MGDPDRTRVVLVAHPFGSSTGADGTEVRSLTLSADGTLADDGTRLDVGFKPRALAFIPSGDFALVVGERGDVASIRVDGVSLLSVVDRSTLPSADYGSIQVSADGRQAYVLGFNSTLESGISTVRVDCQGMITVDTDRFFPMRLSQALAFLPDKTTAILLGGQTTFDPVDPLDTRFLDVTSGAFVQATGLDLWSDFVSADELGVSPDGSLLAVPNASPFSAEGGQLRIYSIGPGTLTETMRFTGYTSASRARFSPDGTTLVLARPEVNRLALFSVSGSTVTPTTQVTGVGIPDHMVTMERGSLRGLLVVSSVDPSGPPNLALLRFGAQGTMTDLGQFSLGSGAQNNPGALAIMP